MSEINGGRAGLAVRAGIWECHGDTVTPSVRNIDNLLSGEQNMTGGTTHAHRPTDVDGLVAQGRAVATQFPSSKLAGFTSDFSKAYKQVPDDPDEYGVITLVQWCPHRRRPVFFATRCQLFGSKTAPLNFARFPAWCCEAMAVLFGAPLTHCVDDMICIEQQSSISCARTCWLAFAKLCGWLISMEKTPGAAQVFSVIGVSIDLRPCPSGQPTVMITKRRIQSVSSLLNSILVSQALTSGVAASLAGKLGFSLSATAGRFGRAMLRPILARSYSWKWALDDNLRACIWWWFRFLVSFAPRPIPTNLESLVTLISYSDGEGGDGGVGAAVWAPWLERPLATFCYVPTSIRDAWAKARDSVEWNDIFAIEAVGPLLLLSVFPRVMRNALWIHYIDNTAAESSLIRGSSRLDSASCIVGATWEACVKRGLLPYFDRVESKANPVDRLSRGVFKGPWDKVEIAYFPDHASAIR